MCQNVTLISRQYVNKVNISSAASTIGRKQLCDEDEKPRKGEKICEHVAQIGERQTACNGIWDHFV